ncbi:carotenoid ester lipase precursor [Multifurca ochricompacta]|uniref:Carboxylic ester hydrolase n=1 Tax=Multifurca ochricompacta TaxID=376703 RepID=A0AAD4QLF6_9AGAM|nr:carotenoid ester lipase precursor [Multifurca ochricompacta]
MRISCVLVALFAGQASLALVTHFEPFVVQKHNAPLTAGFCDGIGSTANARLDKATFTGICSLKTAKFLGIPYAQPPICDRRLRVPNALPPYKGHYMVQKYGPSCPQQRLVLPRLHDTKLEGHIKNITARLYEGLTPDHEDCLTINVVTPKDATPKSKLPVVVWFFGGGFEIGGTSTYDGGLIVARSIQLGEPILFVSMNYRLSALGFLPGKEVKKAKVGNLGLQDQRLALKWVQKYISAFGGDPSKVTIWGESAGAISVAMHMVVNNGKQQGLFRGAIMQSGGPIPVGDIENGQKYYDALVKNAACDHSRDTLACLRKVPYSRLKYAMDISPNFFAYQGLTLAWLPRVDGVFLTENPQKAVQRGHVASVPMITGNCDDEGSMFSVSSLNVTNTAQTATYFKSFMLPTASKEEVDLLLKYYPENPEAGCPFDTGTRNALTSQFKRIAAVQGDIVFHGPRRFLLKYRAGKQRSWAFIHKRGKNVPFIGSAHATDLINSFGGGELMDYVIYFTRNLNPNGKAATIPWPQYNLKKPTALIFRDDALLPVITDKDDYRTAALNYIAVLSLRRPI